MQLGRVGLLPVAQPEGPPVLGGDRVFDEFDRTVTEGSIGAPRPDGSSPPSWSPECGPGLPL